MSYSDDQAGGFQTHISVIFSVHFGNLYSERELMRPCRYGTGLNTIKPGCRHFSLLPCKKKRRVFHAANIRLIAPEAESLIVQRQQG
nr:hypothetical protein [Erwinia sp. Ejp617]